MAATEAASAHPQAINANADPPLQADALVHAQPPRVSQERRCRQTRRYPPLQADPRPANLPPAANGTGEVKTEQQPQAALAARVPNLQASNAKSEPTEGGSTYRAACKPRSKQASKRQARVQKNLLQVLKKFPTLQHWGTTFFGKRSLWRHSRIKGQRNEKGKQKMEYHFGEGACREKSFIQHQVYSMETRIQGLFCMGLRSHVARPLQQRIFDF